MKIETLLEVLSSLHKFPVSDECRRKILIGILTDQIDNDRVTLEVLRILRTKSEK